MKTGFWILCIFNFVSWKANLKPVAGFCVFLKRGVRICFQVLTWTNRLLLKENQLLDSDTFEMPLDFQAHTAGVLESNL